MSGFGSGCRVYGWLYVLHTVTVETAEFVYVGPPPDREWRQPKRGMRLWGHRCALNVPHGFHYDLRVISDPYLGGDRRLYVQIISEAKWFQCAHTGEDERLYAKAAPAYLVWLE